MPGRRLPLCALMLVFGAACTPALAVCYADDSGTALADAYQQQVDRKLHVPDDEQARYAALLKDTLDRADLGDLPAQYFLLVDRNASVQAVMIFWKSEQGDYSFIGASPASTGKPGRFDYFQTPTGIFDHTLSNPDFRAEGTLNEFGILGYGVKGMRVFDFGWVETARGWGDKGPGIMRLQMHATDPTQLEPRLGSAQSKGCVRIPASLNRFIDRYGLLDADYERALGDGQKLWVLLPAREPTPWPGRYLIVLDSERASRPAWSPAPSIR